MIHYSYMDTVILDGVEYVKASVVAKRFRYTSDYIGQLCRGKKVDARLVGRTWFVNPVSLEEHKQNKHQKNEPALRASVQEEKATYAVPINRLQQRRQVAPPLSAKTARALKVTVTPESDTNHPIIQKYETDSVSLLPEITEKTSLDSRDSLVQPTKLQVSMADSKRVKVRKRTKKVTAFAPEPLPTVALSGKLKVSTYEEPEIVEADTDEVPFPVIKPVKSHAKPGLVVQKNSNLHTSPLNLAPHQSTIGSNAPESKKRPVNQPPTVQQPATILPGKQIQFSPSSVQQLQAVRQSLWLRFSPALATVTAFALITLLFAASSQVIVTGSETTSEIIFQLANILTILAQ